MKKSEVKFVETNRALPLKNDEYRTNEQISNLSNNIIENSLEKPIEISVNKNGKNELYNGNHKLLVAEKLGLKKTSKIYKQY